MTTYSIDELIKHIILIAWRRFHGFCSAQSLTLPSNPLNQGKPRMPDSAPKKNSEGFSLKSSARHAGDAKVIGETRGWAPEPAVIFEAAGAPKLNAQSPNEVCRTNHIMLTPVSVVGPLPRSNTSSPPELLQLPNSSIAYCQLFNARVRISSTLESEALL
jgi:hypothetical protein